MINKLLVNMRQAAGRALGSGNYLVEKYSLSFVAPSEGEGGTEDLRNTELPGTAASS